MVLRFFKKSYFYQLAVLILLAVLLWMPEMFMLQQPASLHKTATLPLNPWLSLGVALLFFLVTAFVVNTMGTAHRFTDRNSYLVAFFFILTGSASGFMTIPHPFLAATLFFALFFQKVYRFQNNPNVIVTAFDAGLFLGLTSLFYPPAVLLALFVWFALVVYQTDQWRAYITAIIGVALPWFFIFSGYFLFDKLPLLMPWFLKYFHFREMTNPFQTGMDMAMFALITGVTLVAFLWLTGRLQSFKINLRQHVVVSLWGIIFTVITVFLFNPPLQALILPAVPASLVLGMFFSRIKKLRWAERFVLLWVLFVFINQYLPLFYAS